MSVQGTLLSIATEILIEIGKYYLKDLIRKQGKKLKFEKVRPSVLIEFTILPRDPILIANAKEFLEKLLNDADLETIYLDLYKLVRNHEKIMSIYEEFNPTASFLAYKNDAAWIVLGSLEEYFDIIEKDLIKEISIEAMINVEKYLDEIKNEIEELTSGYDEKVYMFSFIFIPLNKNGLLLIDEVIDRLFWQLNNRLNISASIKIRILSREKIPLSIKDVSIYDQEDHILAIVYSTSALKQITKSLIRTNFISRIFAWKKK